MRSTNPAAARFEGVKVGGERRRMDASKIVSARKTKRLSQIIAVPREHSKPAFRAKVFTIKRKGEPLRKKVPGTYPCHRLTSLQWVGDAWRAWSDSP